MLIFNQNNTKHAKSFKKQLTYVEQDPNVAFNCNKIQIYNKKSAIDA